MAGAVLQPLVFDPLRRLQQGSGHDGSINDADRLWVAVDGMGGDYAPGPILEGCLRAVQLLPLRIKFVAETAVVEAAVASLGFEGIVVRELVKAPERTSAILGTAFVLRIAGGIAAIGLVGLTALLTVNDRATAVLSLIVATAFLPGAFDVIVDSAGGDGFGRLVDAAAAGGRTDSQEKLIFL